MFGLGLLSKDFVDSAVVHCQSPGRLFEGAKRWGSGELFLFGWNSELDGLLAQHQALPEANHEGAAAELEDDDQFDEPKSKLHKHVEYPLIDDGMGMRD
jgi:hypothetical protein